VHRPAEVSAVVRDATGAALKALQCSSQLSVERMQTEN
jgi:hypothetical protein